MNIVVVGGGEPGKFGNDFVCRSKTEGHIVHSISHRKRVGSVFANFTNIDDVISKLPVDHIDILLYNTSVDGYPNIPQNFHSGQQINEKLYEYSFRVHCIIPHAVCNAAMERMDGGKIVFVTTDMIHDPERSKYLDHLGYAGGKAYQHQLMLALAEHNNKNVTVSSISPMFNYNNQGEYRRSFDKAYDYILTHGPEYNGKIFECFD